MWMKANLSIRKKSSWYLTALWNFKINIKEQLAWLNRSYQPSSPEQNIVPQVDICVQHRLKCLPKLFWCGISFKGQLLLRWNKWIDFQSRSLTRTRAHTDTRVWHHHHSLDDATAGRNKYTHMREHTVEGWQTKTHQRSTESTSWPVGWGQGQALAPQCLCALGWGEGAFWTLWWSCMWARFCF